MRTSSIVLLVSLLGVQTACATQDDSQRQNAPRLSTAITGTVIDQSGAAIAGVKVEQRNPSDDALVQTALTNKSGEFAFANMPAGKYRLTFTLSGFQTVTRDVSADGEQFSKLQIQMPVLPQPVR